MAYWLLKSEPTSYSWEQLVADGRTHWDGVRNAQALNNLRAMKLGDYTGIRGFPNQDIAMWETMGPIMDRSRERLGASDLASQNRCVDGTIAAGGHEGGGNEIPDAVADEEIVLETEEEP